MVTNFEEFWYVFKDFFTILYLFSKIFSLYKIDIKEIFEWENPRSVPSSGFYELRALT